MSKTSAPPPAAMPDATDLASDDPALGLRSVVALRRLADSLESLHVDRARAAGWTWQQIALRLGVTRQAVHQKHGTRKER